MELKKKIIIPYKQEYEFREQQKQYQLKTFKNMQDCYVKIDESKINDNMIDFFSKYNKIDIPYLTFGMNGFQKKQQHQMLNDIAKKFKSSLQLHTFTIIAQQMNLYLNNFHIISDFMKITKNDCLKDLKIELQNNHLSIGAISKIMKEISDYFQSLEKITLLFSQNDGELEKQNHKGFISLLSMNNITELKIDLNQINKINPLFQPLQDQDTINHTLRKIEFNLNNTQINLDFLSNIFNICINLKSIKFDLVNSRIENEIQFLTALQSSCQVENLEMNFSFAKFSSNMNEIFNEIFSSEYLKEITINLEYARENLNNKENIFENLKNAKRLEYLNLKLQNNAIEAKEIKGFSEQIKSDSLKTFKLNIENIDYGKQIMIKNIYCLESAILSLPTIQSASVCYSSTKSIQDHSPNLVSYMKDTERLICSYISYTKQIQSFMIFNPQHIYFDLYY